MNIDVRQIFVITGLSCCVVWLYFWAELDPEVNTAFPFKELDGLTITDELWTLSAAAPFMMTFKLESSEFGFTGIANLSVKGGIMPEHNLSYEISVPAKIQKEFMEILSHMRLTIGKPPPTEHSFTDYYPSTSIEFYHEDQVLRVFTDSQFPRETNWSASYNGEDYSVQPSHTHKALDLIYPYFSTDRIEPLVESAILEQQNSK